MPGNDNYGINSRKTIVHEQTKVKMINMSEKVIFPSKEWVAKFKDVVNSSKDYEEAAKTWEGDFIFEIIPDGTRNLSEKHQLYCDLWHGKCRDAFLVSTEQPAPEKVEYIYSGKYNNWLALFDGKVGPLKGIMQRKFTVTCSPGAMARLMKALKAAQELVKCTTMVENVEYI
ncbi:MAG: sterol carrier protein [Candidatus Heimdallarchaeota archaeon]|nr:sterol carrier protein [Candidatus Heimdallarchaeota archaeon]